MMPRRTVTSSVTTLFLLTGVCATLFAMGAAPFRDAAKVEPLPEAMYPIYAILPIAGLVFAYARFERFRYIALGGVTGLVLSVLLAPIAAIPKGSSAELTLAGLVGVVGLLAFQVFIRLSRRKR